MNDETRNMMLKTTPRGRIKNFLNSLALKPIKTSRLMRCCALCACPIQPGEQLRDAGETRRAHEFCFQAVRADRRFQ